MYDPIDERKPLERANETRCEQYRRQRRTQRKLGFSMIMVVIMLTTVIATVMLMLGEA